MKTAIFRGREYLRIWARYVSGMTNVFLQLAMQGRPWCLSATEVTPRNTLKMF